MNILEWPKPNFKEVEIVSQRKTLKKERELSKKSLKKSQEIFSKNDPVNSDALSELERNLQNTIEYPPRARALGWQGLVKVLVKINSLGRAWEIVFLEKDQHEEFNEAVEKALKNWQFSFKEAEIPLTFRFVIKESSN